MEKRMLLVHAHPDDETINQGATMAKYVAQGAQVTLVTCTLGEEGEVLVPGLEHLASDRDDTLGQHRIGELSAAMRELGVTDHRFLGGAGKYRDSGMVWHADGHAVAGEDVKEGTFWRADLTAAAADLVEVIREVRPQVLVTYDEFGGYGHPDHIQAHRVAMYGAALAGARSFRPELGEPWEIAKIYWGAMSESRMTVRACAGCASRGTRRRSRAWTRRAAATVRHSRPPPGRGGRRRRLRRRQDGRDAGSRDADHRRRTVLRPVQQRRQRGLGHGVLPAGQGCPRAGR